jgi:sensor histidine kinase regulating citrate/malate metabolism
MFALIFAFVYITFLIIMLLLEIYKNHELEKDNQKLSLEVNKLLRENSKLRKELKNVL